MWNDGTYEVFEGASPAGTLTLRQNKRMTEFEYTCDSARDLARLVLLTPGGNFSVGIPVPRDGGMQLKRSFTPGALAGVDLDHITRCVLVPVDADIQALTADIPAADATEAAPDAAPAMEVIPEPKPETPEPTPPEPEQKPDCGNGWCMEPDPACHFTDPVLRECAAGVAGVLVRQEGGDTLLAFPFSPSEPFPLIPAFRFGTAQTIDGGHYMVYRIRSGAPV